MNRLPNDRILMPQTLQESKNKQQPPFLKWAGGKRWLSQRIIELIPHNYSTYYEPFLGSGAVYFELTPSKAVLSDLNEDLISTYQAIREDWSKVEDTLAVHHRKHSPDYYYHVRQQQLRKTHTKAAQFIYLNRTCWNGLYRVNLKGEFNVPIGTKSNVILTSDNFQSVAKTLKNTELVCGDFEKTINRAKKNDIVFADPPYTVHHNYNGFIKYNENIFKWEDQVRLSEALKRAASRGAKVIMTNANHDSVRKLYSSGFLLEPISRRSVIAGAATARKSFEELLIVSK